MQRLSATQYTHILNYNRVTAEGETSTESLSARVTFEDSNALYNQDTHPLGSNFNSSFITSVTYTYTPDGDGATPLVISSANNHFESYKMDHDGDTDYDGDPNLLTQLSELQFQSFDSEDVPGIPFELGFTDDAFKVEAGPNSADFNLDTITYHSPAPLPFLGLISSFTFMKKLKAKYKLKSKV